MLLDTSGLLCFLDDEDARHAAASKVVETASVRLAHSYVLSEFIPLCHVRGLSRVKVFEFVEMLIANPLVGIVWIDQRLHQLAFALLQNRLDKNYSLCDAVSFVLMRERGLLEALTTDKHFEQEGFIKLLKS